MKYLFVFLLASVAGFAFISGCSGKRPDKIGLHDGQLAPCPDSPNCVSTRAGDETHAIAPIPISAPEAEVIARVEETIRSMGGRVITAERSYLYAEFTSRFWRFVDDLECSYDENQGVLHVRSASRVGYFDFNVNRNRVEQLRSLLAQGG